MSTARHRMISEYHEWVSGGTSRTNHRASRGIAEWIDGDVDDSGSGSNGDETGSGIDLDDLAHLAGR